MTPLCQSMLGRRRMGVSYFEVPNEKVSRHDDTAYLLREGSMVAVR